MHVLPGAEIGEDCNICDHVNIENDVRIGNRVTIKYGGQIWDGITIEEEVFIGPNVTFTNDPFPRSKQYPEKITATLVCSGLRSGRIPRSCPASQAACSRSTHLAGVARGLSDAATS